MLVVRVFGSGCRATCCRRWRFDGNLSVALPPACEYRQIAESPLAVQHCSIALASGDSVVGAAVALVAGAAAVPAGDDATARYSRYSRSNFPILDSCRQQADLPISGSALDRC